MQVKGELVDAQIELYTTAGRPAAGKKGRKIYDTDLNVELTDNGTTWDEPFGILQSGFDTDTPTNQGIWRSKQHAIGDLVPSFLTEAQFQAEYDTKWVLCDGRGVGGSDYQTLTGNGNIPDARGLALRGKNESRADGKQNPDGELALGTYQADELASHIHSFATSFGPDGNGRVYSTSDLTLTSSVNTSAEGGNETRSKNITVNYFIKINR